MKIFVPKYGTHGKIYHRPVKWDKKNDDWWEKLKMTRRLRIASDIGGTFTDFVVIDEASNTITLGKVLTTPEEPERAIFQGCAQIDQEIPGLLGAAKSAVHGTTLVINALTERKGSRTALVCTRGFRDILEMRDGLRYDVYDLQIEYPTPLVPRSMRIEADERMRANGQPLVVLTESEASRVAAAVMASGAESVAICLLHAYANPAHERMLADHIARAAPGIAISISSDVLSRINEYQRTSTVVANAFIKPRVEQYLGKIADGFREQGFDGDLYVMQSTTGVMDRKTAQHLPVTILESGPAGGVAGAIWWANQIGLRDALSFDMGGTTAKLCPIMDGRAAVTLKYEAGRAYRFKRGSGYSINVPVLDLLEIGTGGGSIAQVDTLGLLRVGPKSAGSVPGPACYGRGGEAPTVTDADLVLGYLDAGRFLGGDMALRADLAGDAIERHIAAPLGMSLNAAADGIHQIANEDMAAAARLHLAEQGELPERLAVIAYGGAGPVHACGLANRLGCHTVIVPPAAGVMSALGMLVADFAMERMRSVKFAVNASLGDSLRVVLDELTAEVEERIASPATGGGTIRLEYCVDAQYVGQGFSVEVPVLIDDLTPTAIIDRFSAIYRRLYGRLDEDAGIELCAARVRGFAESASRYTPQLLPHATLPVESAHRMNRAVYFGELGARISCPVYERSRLRPGHIIKGPALIEERETTTVISPNGTLSVHPLGMLMIELEAQ